MRDPNRINRILGKIKILWDLYPDQRFGQLSQNYFCGETDNFYVEDDETERYLDISIANANKVLGYENSKKNILKIYNKSSNPFPEYATSGDSGFDIRAWVVPTVEGHTTITLRPGERQLIHTGLYMEIPFGFEVQVRPRSGFALKKGASIVNSPGTIDVNYRGEVCVILINQDKYDDITIGNGDKIAQGVLCPVSCESFTKLEEIDSIDTNTQRGIGGFGSTGKS